MKRLLVIVLVLVVGILLTVRRQGAESSMQVPYCGDVANDHYTGHCVTMMVDGVITGDETTH